MGILDWFKNRPGQYDPDRVSDELVQWGVEKAITLTKPRLKLLPTCQECLTGILESPQRFLRIDAKRLRLNSMNVVLDETSSEPAADVDFAVAELSGSPPMRRAFVLARVARTELPSPQKINFDDVARYL